MESNWYCITTNPNCQRRAEAELAQLGYWVFWPRIKKWATHARARTAKEYPLLARYMFVNIPDKEFGRVRCVNGVESFVAVAGVPVAIPSAWVDQMILRHMRGEWDYVTQTPVTYVNSQGVEQTRVNKPIPDRALVRLIEGEFATMLGTVINRLKGGRLRIVPQGQVKPIITRVQNVRAA